MQNKGAIKWFAIIFGIVCAYQMIFTYVGNSVKEDAREHALQYAQGETEDERLEHARRLEVEYLDSMSNVVVLDLIVKKFTFADVLLKELNLGLDLKGGMDVTLEISVPDIVRELADQSADSIFVGAMALAEEREKSTTEDFIPLFGMAYEEIAGTDAKLAAIFSTAKLRASVNYSSSNQEVLNALTEAVDAAITQAFEVIRTRIDRFGVVQPNIQKIENKGQIRIGLPGVDNPIRVYRLLQGAAKLEFWETQEVAQVFGTVITPINAKLASLLKGEVEEVTADNFNIRGNRAILKGISFESDQAKLGRESFPILQEVKKYLLENKSLYAELQGHTDNTASSEYNQKLSEERAKAVYDWLLKEGVKPERLAYKGYGSSQPIADNLTEEGKAKNRRTEMILKPIKETKMAEEGDEGEGEGEGEDTLMDIGNDIEDRNLAENQAYDEVKYAQENPLFVVLTPNIDRQGRTGTGPVVGWSRAHDRAKVDKYLAMPEIAKMIPRDIKFAWTAEPVNDEGEGNLQPIYALLALRVPSDGKAPLSGNVIEDARRDLDPMSSSYSVDIIMNGTGAKIWQDLTRQNVGKTIAVVLDGLVRSYPVVNQEISGGRSQITGRFTSEEAADLANILKSGRLPAPTKIVNDQIVGPSLGAESIRAGLVSFAIAFALVLIYILFIYGKDAGFAANIALIINMFFIIGVLSSLGAVLTLPGIAGIILTIGMSVDANVLIFERIQEERLRGKSMKNAVADGYKNAYSAIIDGNLTTFLTGFVLFSFGSGPVKGFATTLMVGIMTSLFCAIFITRLIFSKREDANKRIAFSSSFTANWLRKMQVNFLKRRRIFYFFSLILVIISVGSLFTRGLRQGIDFQGGRAIQIAFPHAEQVNTEKLKHVLATTLSGSALEVKTYGAPNTVMITTDYLIGAASQESNELVLDKMREAVSTYEEKDISSETFQQNYVKETKNVGPTISNDIKRDAVISVFFALLAIFLYILIRFRTWQYGLGALTALAHDVLIVLGVFSIFYSIMPFSMEVTQEFVAAILTVVGYSINDTVVVFDRIREYIREHPLKNKRELFNEAINHTLRRTFSTSLSTLVVLLSILLFGGTSIKGFAFALFIGVIIGTYSSIFIASPISFDLAYRKEKGGKKAKA